MKNTLKYLVALIIIILVTMIVLDIVYTQVYKHGIPRSKLAFVKSIQNKHYGYIFLGSSRTDNFIDSEIVENITTKPTINLGLTGGKILDYHLMLQVLKDRNITADSVFVQMDYVYNIQGGSKIPMSTLMQFMQDPVIQNFVKEENPEYYYLKKVPFYRYMTNDFKVGLRELLLVMWGKKPRTDYNNGYNPPHAGSAPNKIKGTLPSKLIDDNEEFDKLTEFASDFGYNLVFFTSPFCKNLKNEHFIKDLKKKIPNLIDYSRALNNDDYFYDCSHVNTTGAKVFSEIIATDLIKK